MMMGKWMVFGWMDGWTDGLWVKREADKDTAGVAEGEGQW